MVTHFACDVLEKVSIAFVVDLGVLAATMPSLGRSAFTLNLQYTHTCAKMVILEPEW